MKLPKLFRPAPFVAGLLVLTSFAGCWKKGGEAIVLGKEHIDVAETSPTPTPGPASSAALKNSVEPAASPQDSPASEEYVQRKLAPDEIVIDSYVMKRDARGTSKDPRALDQEQWLVQVEMVQDLRRITVRTDRRHFDKVKVGDRIKVSYHQGKYTGTVWSAQIND